MTLRFPQLPETRVTRQVECVSCKYIFTVSEDIPDRAGPRSSWWTRVSGQSPFAMRQPRRDLQRQPVVPQPDNHPHEPHRETPWQSGVYHTINCPRCGADNRNWIHVLNTPLKWWTIAPAQAGLIVAVALFLLSCWQLYVNEFSPQYWVLLSVFFYLFGWVLPRSLINQWKTVRKHKHISNTSPNAPNRYPQTPPFIWAALFSYAFGAFVFLFLATIAIPWAGNFAERLINPPPETLQARVDAILAVLQQDESDLNIPAEQSLVVKVRRNNEANLIALASLVNQVEQSCNLAPISTAVATLEGNAVGSTSDQRGLLIQDAVFDLRALLAASDSPCQSSLVAMSIISMNNLKRYEEQTCLNNNEQSACEFALFLDNQIAELTLLELYTPSREPLSVDLATLNLIDLFLRLQPITTAVPDEATQQIIEGNLLPIEQTVGTAVADTGWFAAGADYLNIWLVNLGLAGLISITTAIAAAYNYADEVDKSMPRPIYESTAKLTSVVIWEAAKTLNISEVYLDEIRWTGARRNEQGGITLNGQIYYPSNQETNLSPSTYYIIESNIWGHITDSYVVDRGAPPIISPVKTIPIPVSTLEVESSLPLPSISATVTMPNFEYSEHNDTLADSTESIILISEFDESRNFRQNLAYLMQELIDFEEVNRAALFFGFRESVDYTSSRKDFIKNFVNYCSSRRETSNLLRHFAGLQPSGPWHDLLEKHLSHHQRFEEQELVSQYPSESISNDLHIRTSNFTPLPERTTNLEFPESCQLNRNVELKIQMTIDSSQVFNGDTNNEDDSGDYNELFISHSQNGQDDEVIDLDIFVFSENFDVDAQQKTLNVPFYSNSNEVVFNLVGKEVGDQIIEVEFYNRAARIGYAVIETKIVPN